MKLFEQIKIVARYTAYAFGVLIGLFVGSARLMIAAKEMLHHREASRPENENTELENMDRPRRDRFT